MVAVGSRARDHGIARAFPVSWVVGGSGVLSFPVLRIRRANHRTNEASQMWKYEIYEDGAGGAANEA